MGRLRSLLAGIAIGASAVYLSDKKNREKVVKKGKQLKAAAEKEFKDIKSSAAKTVTTLKKKVEQATK